MATMTPKTAEVSVEANIKKLKKKIETLRAKLNDPVLLRNADATQTVYDQIEEAKREIEQLTRGTRKAVPITNAPIVGQRHVSRRKRNFTIY